MSRLLLLGAMIALFLGITFVAHAQQSTAPTVSTVAITSSPGTDNTYATGDTITVTRHLQRAGHGHRHAADHPGHRRAAPLRRSTPATGTARRAQILFSYTALVSDTDADGVTVLANSLALNGGAIRATDDSTAATLTHAAMTFANHKDRHAGHHREQPQPAGVVRNGHH